MNIELSVRFDHNKGFIDGVCIYACMRDLIKTNGYVGGKDTKIQMNFMSLI
jgi:hypothetical protein